MVAKRVKQRKILPLLLVSIILVSILYFTVQRYLSPTLEALSTQGYTEVTIGLNTTDDKGIVSFFGDCYELQMIIDKSQAISIENGILGVISFRPSTHDLINDMLKNLDAKILMIKVTKMEDNTFFARILLRKGVIVLNLDSRPSDALAIAARTDYRIPVYVNDSLLGSYGKKVC